MYSTVKFKVIFVGCALLLLQGCASRAVTDCGNDVECRGRVSSSNGSEKATLGINTHKPEYVIATDLINALVQVPSYSKPQTTIKLPNSNSTFMSAVQDVLLERGFRVVRSPQRTGKGVLMVSTTQESENSAFFSYILAIDRLAMRRTYLIKNKLVAPVSSLFVRGITPSLIKLNDGIFIE